MVLKSPTFIFCLLLLLNIRLIGQSTPIDSKVQSTFAEKIGHIESLGDLAKRSPTSKEKRASVKRRKAAPRNFVGRGLQPILKPELAFHGPDAVAQRSPLSKTTVIDLNFDGLTSGSSPNDPTGDIGKDHYVQAVNVTDIGVYAKDGTLLSSFAANTLWQPLGFFSAGDPIVLYDQLEDRWLITEFPDPNQLLVAISTTSDPLGGYNVYNFATPNFPDYPKYAVWENVYTVTTNEAGPDVLHAYIIDKPALVAGENSVSVQRVELPGNLNSETGFLVATPVDLSGDITNGSPPMFMRLNDSSWGDSPEDAIEIYSIDVDFDNPANTQVNNQRLFVSPYDSNPCSVNTGGQFPCIPQPPGGFSLDGIPEVIMNQVHYRNFGTHESIVLNFITDVDGNNLSGIRWMELRRTSGQLDWSVYQEGTFTQPDGLDRFMGNSAIDEFGNIALAYTVSSETEFAGLRLTGRFANDPLGEMTVQEEILVSGQSVNQSFARMGDYAHMSIDPVDGTTFWTTAEYAGPDEMNTRITSFKLQKFNNDLATSRLLTPQSGTALTDSEPIQIRISNLGLSPISDFELGYRINDGPIISESVSFALDVNETYEHTFNTTADLSAFGEYRFEVFNTMAGDDFTTNDTLRLAVNHIAAYDLATRILPIGSTVCRDETTIQLSISNRGTETIDSFDLKVVTNGAEEITSISQTIEPGLTTLISRTISGLNAGANTIEASAQNLNGNVDQISANDVDIQIVETNLSLLEYKLSLLLDSFPDETSWILEDPSGSIIASGGPYTEPVELIESTFCLDTALCYQFTIFDLFGDGICCDFGVGSYQITSPTGAVVINSTGEFAESETAEICASSACALSASAALTNASGAGASDGAILIDASNGVAPYSYSIDNGISYQASSVFDNLAPGTYDILVVDAFGNCSFSLTVVITVCDLIAEAQAVNPSGSTASDGSITILVEGSNGTLSYSIDGGASFQTGSTFNNLGNGTYQVVVSDDRGCSTTLSVTLDGSSSTSQVDKYDSIVLYPNPTEGVFHINVNGLANLTDRSLPLTIFDVNGKPVYSSSLTRYDAIYTGDLSLYAYPAGVYFVRFEHPNFEKLLRVVRQ